MNVNDIDPARFSSFEYAERKSWLIDKLDIPGETDTEPRLSNAGL